VHPLAYTLKSQPKLGAIPIPKSEIVGALRRYS